MTTVRTDERFVFDRREIGVDVTDAPVLCTRSGNNPIAPYHVRIHFDIADRIVTEIVVLGKPTPGSAPSWRINRGYVRRRVEEANAPEWLAALIEKYRP